MSKVYKSGKQFQGNENSGRKTIKQEVEEAKELITQEALIALANSRVYKQMVKESGIDEYDYLKTKELSLPITLKGMTDKKDLNLNLIVEISETIAKKRNIDVATPKAK